jgi:hypothetical protein
MANFDLIPAARDIGVETLFHFYRGSAARDVSRLSLAASTTSASLLGRSRYTRGEARNERSILRGTRLVEPHFQRSASARSCKSCSAVACTQIPDLCA